MIKYFRQKKWLITAVTVFLLLLLFFLFRPSPPPVEVISTFPASQAKDTGLLPEIKAVLNQKISPKQVSLLSEPALSFKQMNDKVPSNTIIFQPTQVLAKKTTYKFTLRFKSGYEYSWAFTTSETEAGALPGWSENSERALNEFRQNHPPEEVAIVDAFIFKIPYFSTNYWIDYYNRTNTFVVHLCREPFEKTRKEADAWFDQQKINKLIKLKPKINWLYGCQPPKIIPDLSITPIR